MSKKPREWTLIYGVAKSSGRSNPIIIAMGDLPGKDEIIKVVEVIETPKDISDEQAEPET